LHLVTLRAFKSGINSKTTSTVKRWRALRVARVGRAFRTRAFQRGKGVIYLLNLDIDRQCAPACPDEWMKKARGFLPRLFLRYRLLPDHGVCQKSVEHRCRSCRKSSQQSSSDRRTVPPNQDRSFEVRGAAFAHAATGSGSWMGRPGCCSAHSGMKASGIQFRRACATLTPGRRRATIWNSRPSVQRAFGSLRPRPRSSAGY
jgi:hypothetical protein